MTEIKTPSQLDPVSGAGGLAGTAVAHVEQAGGSYKATMDEIAALSPPSHPLANFPMYGTAKGYLEAAAFTDFLDNVSSDAYQTDISGTGSSVANTMITGIPGVCALDTGTTSSGYAYIYVRRTFMHKFPGTKRRFAAKVWGSALSSVSHRYVLQLGIMDLAGPGNEFNGIWFEYTDNVNSGNWVCKTMKAGVLSTANTSIPHTVINTGHTLEFEYEAGVGVNFYIDGVLVATITTNLPTAGEGAPTAGITKTSGTTARFAYVDFLGEYEAGLTR